VLFIGGNSDSFLDIISTYFNRRWFVPAYLLLYILSPLLNSFIGATSNKQLGRYILIFYIYSTIVGYLLRSSEFNEGMSAISVIGLYLIGVFIHKSKAKWLTMNVWMDLIMYLFLSIFLSIVALGLKYYGIEKSPIGYLNPIVIIMTVYLFLFFKKLNIRSSSSINYVAASAFAVYLFHYHPSIINYYNYLCKAITEQGLIAIILVPLLFIIIFTFCVILDRIRMYIFNCLDRFFELTLKKI
jgi:surface polysaccharide O-acyltransferase-like enzyme